MELKGSSSSYNEKVSCWTLQFIKESYSAIVSAIVDMAKANPERFLDIKSPFTVAEYGCATGQASIGNLVAIIRTVRAVNASMPIMIYLNDMPKNHHEIAINTVTEGLFGAESQLEESLRENIHLYVVGKDFTKTMFPVEYVDFGYSNMAA